MIQTLTYKKDTLENSFANTFGIKNVDIEDNAEALEIIEKLIFHLDLSKTLKVTSITNWESGTGVKIVFVPENESINEKQYIESLKKLNDHIHPN